MKTLKRKNCIMCKNSFEEVYTFKEFPVYMGTTSKTTDQDLYADMTFVKCVQCSCVQIRDLIPLEVLYADGHASVIGKTWEKHHSEFCDFVKKYAHGSIVEVGGANLVVAKRLAQEEKVDKITVFDNNILKYGDCDSSKIVLKEEFFDPHKTEGTIDAILHTHLIEHLYNPLEEIQKMSSLLEDGAYMMFAAPMIDKMLKDNFTNAFNFEHTYLLSRAMIDNILAYAQFEIIDEMAFSPYASFFVARKNTQIDYNINHDYREDIDKFTDFLEYHQNAVNSIIKALDGEKEKTFVFGAHIFTQYLLGFGLQEESFANILDNDPQKIGNRLYGTDLLVKSPKILKEMEEPLVVLKAAQYTEEIMTDILENINSGTRFIL